jgi:hypothetical protein
MPERELSLVCASGSTFVKKSRKLLPVTRHETSFLASYSLRFLPDDGAVPERVICRLELCVRIILGVSLGAAHLDKNADSGEHEPDQPPERRTSDDGSHNPQ